MHGRVDHPVSFSNHEIYIFLGKMFPPTEQALMASDCHVKSRKDALVQTHLFFEARTLSPVLASQTVESCACPTAEEEN